MSSGIAFSRFGPPAYRMALLPRAGLHSRLALALEHPLTVLTAPAGYGKTCLLTQWRGEQIARGVEVGWLSIVEDDLEPLQLLSDLVLSIAQAGRDLGQLESLAEQGFSDMIAHSVITKLTAALVTVEREWVFIIDDVHRIKGAVFKEVLEPLLHMTPLHLHFVLSSRERPPLNYPDLHSRGLLLRFDAGELRFTAEEAKALLTSIPASQIDRLVSQTEGWPIALQLSRVWLAARPERAQLITGFSGRSAEMAEYLTEQVLADLPVESASVLRDLAILDTFNADLVAAVTGDSRVWSSILEARKLEYLLVPLDEERYWFRYHNLLADYLRDRLSRAAFGYVATLHARASEWFEAHGMLVEAVRHASAAGDYRRAAALIERRGIWEMIHFGGIANLRQLLQAIPVERLYEFPRIQFGRALLLAKAGDVRGAHELYIATREATADFTRVPEEQRAAIQRDALIVSGIVSRYADAPCAPDALEELYRSIETLQADDEIARTSLLNTACLIGLALGNMTAALSACQRAVRAMRRVGSVLGLNYCYLHLGLTHLYLGSRREAEAIFREALALAEENFGADSGLRACADALLAAALHASGDIPGAKHHLQRSLDQIESGDGALELYVEAYDVAATVAFMEQGYEGLTEILQRMQATARTRDLTRLLGLVEATTARFAVLAGRLDHAEAALARVHPPYLAGRWRQDPFSWRVHHAAGLATALLALTREDYARATAVLEDLSAAAKAGQRIAQLAIIRALQAVVKLRARDVEGAVRALLEILEERVAEDDLQSLASLGPLIAPLVQATRAWTTDHWSSMRVQNAVSTLASAISRFGVTGQKNELPLSPRELEVLAELINGASNKMIARTLRMTENTVKFHLKNIFQKLNVRHRTEAIRIARAKSPAM